MLVTPCDKANGVQLSVILVEVIASGLFWLLSQYIPADININVCVIAVSAY
jgi:hypothetical protein